MEWAMEVLHPLLAAEPSLAAAYLFGSRVAGRARAESDIDLALLLDPASPRPDRKALLERWLAPLSRALRGDVHLLILNDASLVARMQVLRTGHLVYVGDGRILAEFRMYTLSDYLDFAPYLRRSRRGLFERLEKACGR